MLPPQSATDSTCQALEASHCMRLKFCQTQNMNEYGWIHTHPTQDQMMSSIDMHSTWNHQKIEKSSISIVVSIKDTPHIGYYRLNETGMNRIQSCANAGENFCNHPKSWYQAAPNYRVTANDDEIKMWDYRYETGSNLSPDAIVTTNNIKPTNDDCKQTMNSTSNGDRKKTSPKSSSKKKEKKNAKAKHQKKPKLSASQQIKLEIKEINQQNKLYCASGKVACEIFRDETTKKKKMRCKVCIQYPQVAHDGLLLVKTPCYMATERGLYINMHAQISSIGRCSIAY